MKGVFFAWLLFFLTPLNGGCQPGEDPYKGLNDNHMIQVLKDFPRKANRWNVPAEDGRLLYDLILEHGYKRVLEVGTSNGYSALWMGFALKKTGGRLITIEINEQRAEEARRNIAQAGLSDVIEVRLNDALDEISQLDGSLGMVFLDADKSQYINYYRMLDPMISRGGMVTAHNVSTMEYAMRDFLDAIRDNPAYRTEVRRASSQGVLVAVKKANREVQ